MSRNQLLLRLMILLGAGSGATLFVVQNAGVEASLGLNVGFAAWRFAEPQPVALLMLAALGVGLVLGGGWGMARASSHSRRAQRLEREMALDSSASEPSVEDEWTG